MKTNLSVICLLPNYGKSIAKQVCDKLEMYFADVQDMFDFELGDTNHIMNVLGKKDGKKYIRENEVKVIKRICSFENTFINISPDTLFGNRNFDRIKKSSYLIYLQISPKNFGAISEESKDVVDEKLLAITFAEKDKLFVEKSDVVVTCSNPKDKKVVKKVLSALSDFFKKQKKLQKKGK